MKYLFLSLAVLFAAVSSAFAMAPDLTLELHAHLFMKQGMSFAFHGDFNDPLQAQTYKDGLSSQANPESLEKSGIGIVVVSLYANPFLVGSLQDSIREQIKMARSFVASHSNWVIAKNASEAKSALDDGKRVLVLSLEGASGIIESDDDIREFVDEAGISIVTLLHLTDDQLGGVALLGGSKVLSSPISWARSIFSPNRKDGVTTNLQGLTPGGRILTRKLIEHGVWIDLAHSSDESQRELIPMIRSEGLPLLYTHTVLRKYYPAERALASWQLAEVKRSRGFVGVLPSEEMLSGTKTAFSSCDEGLGWLATQYKELVEELGDTHVALGSDVNGSLNHIAPGCDFSGLWNIGQFSKLWHKLASLGAPVPKPRRLMIDGFLETWSRVRKSKSAQSN